MKIEKGGGRGGGGRKIHFRMYFECGWRGGEEEEEEVHLSREGDRKRRTRVIARRNIAIICKVYEGYINFAKTVENR